MPREPEHRYLDPVDEIWLATARKLGLRVQRSDAAYASYDGRGTLNIATRAEFDADDCLAQIIFHELCHALVTGPYGAAPRGLGLVQRRRARLAARACVSSAAGGAGRAPRSARFLRRYHRPPPVLGCPAGRSARHRRRSGDRVGKGGIERARIGAVGGGAGGRARAQPRASPPRCDRSPISCRYGTRRATCTRAASRSHRGRPARARAAIVLGRTTPGLGVRCRVVAWLAPARDRSRYASNSTRTPASAGSRPGGDPCAECGACCRQGFDLVPVRAREPLVRIRPDLLRTDRHGLHVPRPNGRCAALTVSDDGSDAARYRCSVYADRPRACAEFEVFGDACLQARRRVGLSR